MSQAEPTSRVGTRRVRPEWRLERRTALICAAALVLAGWFGHGWWAVRQERVHCQTMVTREADLEAGTVLAESDYTVYEVDDGIIPADRKRYLANVRREIEKCQVNGVPLD